MTSDAAERNIAPDEWPNRPGDYVLCGEHLLLGCPNGYGVCAFPRPDVPPSVAKFTGICPEMRCSVTVGTGPAPRTPYRRSMRERARRSPEEPVHDNYDEDSSP